MNVTKSTLCRIATVSALSLTLLPAAASPQTGSTATPDMATGAQVQEKQMQEKQVQDKQVQDKQVQGDGMQASGASGAGAGTASGAAKQPGTASRTSSAKPSVAFVLVPVLPAAQDPMMKSGCWARLHDLPNFAGDTLTLSGPVDMPDMVGPFGVDWKGKISSIETGAKTTLTIYDNENYRDVVSVFKPGMRVADVSKRMGFFDEMSSLKVSCGGTTGK